jgi:hypothetical protein
MIKKLIYVISQNMDMQLLVNEILNKKYEYDIQEEDNTISIKLNQNMEMIVISSSRSFLILDQKNLDKIHMTIPRNIKCMPSKNYVIFRIINQQNIIDSYLDLTSLYYELESLKNDAIKKLKKW